MSVNAMEVGQGVLSQRESAGAHATAGASAIDTSALDDQIAFALRIAQLAVFKDLGATLRPFDLRPGQYAVLKIIADNPGLSQGDLGERLNIKKPNLATLMSEFETRGLIVKERRLSDGRLRLLALSREGERVMRAVEVAHANHQARIERLIGPADKAHLMRMLGRLATAGGDWVDREADERSV